MQNCFLGLLRTAIRRGWYNTAKLLIRYGVSQELLDKELQHELLFLAIQYRQPKILEQLIESRVDISRMKNGVAPIHYAAICRSPFGSRQCISVLVENGADINQRMKNGDTVISLIGTAPFLVHEKITPEKKWDQMSYIWFNSDWHSFLVGLGATVSDQCAKRIVDRILWTNQSQKKIIQAFEVALSPEQISKYAKSIGNNAVVQGSLKLLEYLANNEYLHIDTGDIEADNARRSLKAGYTDLAIWMIENGGAQGYNPEELQSLAVTSMLEKIDIAFLKAIFPAIETTDHKRTLLWLAVLWGKIDVIEYLVDQGVDTQFVKKPEQNVLEKAIERLEEVESVHLIHCLSSSINFLISECGLKLPAHTENTHVLLTCCKAIETSHRKLGKSA